MLGSPFSIHNDVLCAVPEDAASADRLVEEIKRRAKIAIQSRNYPEANALYTKALSVQPSAILHANRSLVRLSLNQAVEALEDANAAIAVDPAYAKAYFRKGAALNALRDYAQACAAFQQALEFEPQDKAAQEQLARAQRLLESEKSSSDSEPKIEEPQATTPFVPVRDSTSPVVPMETEQASSTSCTDLSSDESNMRGYKRTADGRVTTYFHKELTEEEKALIGDIAPKKLEQVDPASAVAVSSGAGSVWNHAGTWEERSFTAWATERLQQLCGSVTFETPIGQGAFVVSRIIDIVGDASITLARGKRKHIYDFVINLEWEGRLACGIAKGTMCVKDVTADAEYEVDVQVDSLTAPAARPMVDMYVSANGAGLQHALFDSFSVFREEFRQK